jgi:tetratricopeptide (TPR) repeat protein
MHQISRARSDVPTRKGAADRLGRNARGKVNSAEGLALANEAVRLAREHRLVVPLLRCLGNHGLAWHDLGDNDKALGALGEGLALAEKIGDEAFIPRYLNTIGWLRIECGDFAEGIPLSERSYEVTNRSSRAGHGAQS